MKVGYIGIDQYNQQYTIDKYPRKELLEYLGAKGAQKMYTELKSGGSRHEGYVILGYWIRVFEVHQWDKPVIGG